MDMNICIATLHVLTVLLLFCFEACATTTTTSQISWHRAPTTWFSFCASPLRNMCISPCTLTIHLSVRAKVFSKHIKLNYFVGQFILNNGITLFLKCCCHLLSRISAMQRHNCSTDNKLFNVVKETCQRFC